VEEDEVGKAKFKRVLNVVDLTALGTGSTLGCGVYVLAGTVAKSVAGPAVVLSFILAATVSSFSGKRIFFQNRLAKNKTINTYFQVVLECMDSKRVTYGGQNFYILNNG